MMKHFDLTKKHHGVAWVCLWLFVANAQANWWSWLTGQEHEQDSHVGHEHSVAALQNQGSAEDFAIWLAANPDQQPIMQDYERYLQGQLGQVPPMHELLTSARSWQTCGFAPYQVPPKDLWANMVPTLKLYQELKSQNIIPKDAQIRSVYRNPEQNACAGGAASSKHINNAAIDIWVARFGDESPALYDMKDALCSFWQQQGSHYNFGLGLYATGAVHLDTQGYRKWGMQFSREGSLCQTLTKTYE